MISRDEIITELQVCVNKLIEDLIRSEDLPKGAKSSIEAVLKPQLEALWSALAHVTRLPED